MCVLLVWSGCKKEFMFGSCLCSLVSIRKVFGAFRVFGVGIKAFVIPGCRTGTPGVHCSPTHVRVYVLLSWSVVLTL